jgi:cation diffusion facilitator CzcD-associated flavoprotein CzcO
MTTAIDVAIVGAGPYGLSIASHLSALGVRFRIFGVPMQTWRAHMPAGMYLKSDGSSSDLSDPDGALTLKSFCAQRGYDHHDTKKPVSLECFVEYGLAFQKRFVPELETKQLISLGKLAEGFLLHFSDGETVPARRVVVAVGITHFRHLPDFLAGLAPELVSHSSLYGPVDDVVRRRVAVVGAGASALDLAALLHERGADVSVIARRSTIDFHGAPRDRALWRRLARPTSGIGNGWRLYAFSTVPQLFHALPAPLRRSQVDTLLGPATGWFMKHRIVGRVPIFTGHTPLSAVVRENRVHLSLSTGNGTTRELIVDHVIAATGYRIDLARLPFMTGQLRSLIRVSGCAPVLSSSFESSVPGLFFVGPIAMYSFGPVVRFVYGAKYTARCISRYIARSRLGFNAPATTRRAKGSPPPMGVDADLAPP